MWFISPMFLSIRMNFTWKIKCYFLACLTALHFIHYRNEHGKNCCVVGLLSGWLVDCSPVIFQTLSIGQRPENSSAVTGTPLMVLPQSYSEGWAWTWHTPQAASVIEEPQRALSQRVPLRGSFLPSWVSFPSFHPNKELLWCYPPQTGNHSKSRLASFEHHPGEQSPPDKERDPPSPALHLLTENVQSDEFANVVFPQWFWSAFQSQMDNTTKRCGRKIRGTEGTLVSLYNRNNFLNNIKAKHFPFTCHF